ncbi:MAG: sensor histidine kinase [Clostridiales bacterium]|nr:sensor histidine kinase [Clostridiales bacterium]
MKKNTVERNTDKRSEEKGFRAVLSRVTTKYDFRNERQFSAFWRWLTFILLVLVEIFILLQHIDEYALHGGDGKVLFALLLVEITLTISQALKLFVVGRIKGRIFFYTFDALAACCFMFLTVQPPENVVATANTASVYPVVIFALILTEFYIDSKGYKTSVAMLCVGIAVYIAADILRAYYVLDVRVEVFATIRQSLSTVSLMIIHFLVVQVALGFYRQYLRLEKTLAELDKSKKELEEAYEVVAEVTALEERQRIAKEIHDTAGHSITTVIMQTESAKLIIDTNPEEAKKKIVSANLQAKHALEELRDSVHLLSGIHENATLYSALLGIIHESTDGTGITVRWDIEEITVSPTKYRFLCNTLKEGISNGLRHGNATAFWFELKKEGEKIRFLLSDNGKGVDGDVEFGFGLSSMKERAKALGGALETESETGEGFELRLTLPVDKDERGGI